MWFNFQSKNLCVCVIDIVTTCYMPLHACSYASGRQAISQTRCDSPGPLSGSRGMYTLIFDDTERPLLLGYFTPTGKACCYYQSGAIRMLSDSKGGCLYSEVRPSQSDNINPSF